MKIFLSILEFCPFESQFVDCLSLFMNSKIGGPERQLHSLLQPRSSPFLLVFDHGECLLSLANDETSEETLQMKIQGPSIERRLYLIFRDAIDKLARSSEHQFYLVILTPSRALLPAEILAPGRLNRYWTVSISSSQQRKVLLTQLLCNIPFESYEARVQCIEILAGQPTSGFTYADLEGFIRRVLETSKQFYTLSDFLNIRNLLTPSSITGRAALKPKLDIPFIVGLQRQQERINSALLSVFKSERAPRGILLHGPSGCGKSLLASTLSSFSLSAEHRLPITFISVDSASLLGKYFGQSERNLAQVFADARAAAPCILFFDQIDALAGRRKESGNDSSDRLVTTFLVEMDGFARKSQSAEETVIVLATTSKRDSLDPAILRPGRLDLHIEVPLPDLEARSDFIIKYLEHNKGFHLEVDEIMKLLDETEGFTFADLDALFREATLTALREDINCTRVEYRHFG